MKIAKIFRFVALGLLIFALLLAVTGTVLMFMAEYEAISDTEGYGFNYHYGYYDDYDYYESDYYFEAAPWVGVMPFFGVLTMVAALVCLAVSKKKMNASIGTIVTSAVAIDLLVFSVFLLSWDMNVLPIIGYFICVAAACILVFVFTLSLLYRIFMGVATRPKKEKAGKKEEEGDGKKKRPLTPYNVRLEQAATVIKQLKELWDAGVLTEDEFRREKQLVFDRFEIVVVPRASAVESASVPYTKATD